MENRTLEIIKNFANITKSMIFKEGDVLCVTAPSGSMIATAKLPDNFDKEFALYNVSEFLGMLMLFSEPSIDYTNDDYMLIKDGVNNNKAKYYYSASINIKSSYGLDVHAIKEETGNSTAGDLVVSFDISKSDLATADKVGKVMKLQDLQIDNNGAKILNTDDGSKGNEFDLNVDNLVVHSEILLNSDTYVIYLADLMLLSDDYTVNVHERLFEFVAKNGDVVYHVAKKDV